MAFQYAAALHAGRGRQFGEERQGDVLPALVDDVADDPEQRDERQGGDQAGQDEHHDVRRFPAAAYPRRARM